MRRTNRQSAARPAPRGVRTPRGIGRTIALALFLIVGAGVWTACDQARPETADGRPVPGAAGQFASTSASSAGTALTVVDSDEVAEFFRAIREPLSPSNGAGLPAHQQILGITIEGDAGGQPGEVRTLVLDLGDLSVRAVDQDTR